MSTNAKSKEVPRTTRRHVDFDVQTRSPCCNFPRGQQGQEVYGADSNDVAGWKLVGISVSEIVTRNSTREQDRRQQATLGTGSGDVAVHVDTESAATRKHGASTNQVRGRITFSRAQFYVLNK